MAAWRANGACNACIESRGRQSANLTLGLLTAQALEAPLAGCPRSLLLAHRYRLRSTRMRHRTAAQPGLPRDSSSPLDTACSGSCCSRPGTFRRDKLDILGRQRGSSQ
eukprot:scaffold1553_cov169-Pinguiococcus_pyrenoidosus.AAC.2